MYGFSYNIIDNIRLQIKFAAFYFYLKIFEKKFNKLFTGVKMFEKSYTLLVIIRLQLRCKIKITR